MSAWPAGWLSVLCCLRAMPPCVGDIIKAVGVACQLVNRHLLYDTHLHVQRVFTLFDVNASRLVSHCPSNGGVAGTTNYR